MLCLGRCLHTGQAAGVLSGAAFGVQVLVETRMSYSEKGPKGYRRLIPSLTGLLQFEAVARKRSFTQASHELGVTQAAVSKQVKSLEQLLGVMLFQRAHRSIELTREGEELYAVVSQSMQRIAAVFDRLSNEDAKHEMVLAATAAFSHFCVLPRLEELRTLHPEIQLRLSTQMFSAGLRGDEVDLAVRFGSGKWRGMKATLLFDEEVFPVCSPEYLEKCGGQLPIDQLMREPLIGYDATTEGWMGWEDWFEVFGITRPRLKYALRCSLYTDAIQAALRSQGVALGWKRLLEDDLSTGRLVRLTTVSHRPQDAYYAVLPSGQALTPVLGSLISWLRREGHPSF